MITDKLVAKIPSSYAGKVTKLSFKADEICQVGQSLLEMEVADDVKVKEEAKGEEPAAHEEAKPEPKPKQEAKAPEAPVEGKVLATPAVRGLAAELKVDLKKVKATGKGGRVTKSDVLKFAEEMKSAGASQGGAAPAAKEEHVTKTPAAALAQDRTVKLTGMRKAMTKSMTDALIIPPYNIQEDFSIEKLKVIRKSYAAAYPKHKITYLPFFVKACSQAMLQFPMFNSVVNPTLASDGYISEYIQKADHNIAIAIDSPAGLVVPNIKSVQNKSIMEISEDLKQLIERARKSTLTHDDLSDATFTFSNIGNLGCLNGTPMIFRPQVALAAMGKTRVVAEFTKLPNGEFKMTPTEVVGVSLSCDHRIVDGATGAKFITLVKKYIEDIDCLLYSMK